MKKLALLVTLVTIGAASVAIGNAVAGDPNPIDVETGFACNVFDANGNLFTTFQSNDTLYQSGKETLHCIGQGAGNGSVVTQSGFGCNLIHSVSFSPANSSRVSKTGESQLWCYGSVSDRAAASGAAGAVG